MPKTFILLSIAKQRGISTMAIEKRETANRGRNIDKLAI
jgi:hypothetical protein